LLGVYQRTACGEPDHAHGENASHGEGHGTVAHSLSAAANPDAAHADHEHADIHDVTPIEWVAWAPFLIAIVVFGVYPNLMFKIMDPAVNGLIDQMAKSLGAP